MAHAMRPLMQWPRWHHHCCSRAAFYHFLASPISSNSCKSRSRQLFLFTSSFSFCNNTSVHFRSRALRLRDVPLPPDSTESDSDSYSSDANLKKSRNEKKREAKRAVQWSMQLANFSPPQIKRILIAAKLEGEVYDALMLVKRLGRDVREGKRRQFNYIGRLLREVDPELMDGLIEATKDGDQNKFQALSGSETVAIEDDDVDEAEETEDEYDEEESQHHIDVATRWFDGLINKDIDITNEIYSLQDIDFDRQQLRRLVRKVHFVRDHEGSSNENSEEVGEGVAAAKRSLTRILRGLAKQLSVE